MKKKSIPLNKCILVLLLLAAVAGYDVKAQSGTGQSLYSNVAQEKGASASSAADAAHAAMYAFDGSMATRYTSNYNESQWLSVDLGKSYFLNSVIIVWEKSYGRDFNILFSSDGTFTDMIPDSIQIRNHLFKAGSSVNTDTIALKSGKSARYVRLQGLHSATGNGYSIWEMMVMGATSNANLFPVSVTVFTASPVSNANLLEWTTNTEFSNAGFSIEHSNDAINFSVIGWVSARNAGSVITRYSFTDKQAFPGKNYYRLKQVWLDGKSGYSPVITITIAGSSSVNAYPVPVKDRLSIDYKGVAGENISIALFNATGIPVYYSKVVMQSSQQTIIVNRNANMKTGQYFLKIISSNNKVYMEKIILE
jgi:F5/8 type C domain/Secretion system C-terminal sorting domain